MPKGAYQMQNKHVKCSMQYSAFINNYSLHQLTPPNPDECQRATYHLEICLKREKYVCER